MRNRKTKRTQQTNHGKSDQEYIQELLDNSKIAEVVFLILISAIVWATILETALKVSGGHLDINAVIAALILGLIFQWVIWSLPRKLLYGLAFIGLKIGKGLAGRR